MGKAQIPASNVGMKSASEAKSQKQGGKATLCNLRGRESISSYRNSAEQRFKSLACKLVDRGWVNIPAVDRQPRPPTGMKELYTINTYMIQAIVMCILYITFIRDRW